MLFIIKWLIMYAAVMFAMSLDNICWISASPEYPQYKRWKLSKKLKYIFKERILTVLTHPRDIFPAILTSFLMAVFL